MIPIMAVSPARHYRLGMNRSLRNSVGLLTGIAAAIEAQQPSPKPEIIGERPVITEHLDQNAIITTDKSASVSFSKPAGNSLLPALTY